MLITLQCSNVKEQARFNGVRRKGLGEGHWAQSHMAPPKWEQEIMFAVKTAPHQPTVMWRCLHCDLLKLYIM